MLHLSRTEGTGGRIKGDAQDFKVMEITDMGKALELDRKYTSEELGYKEAQNGKFSTFVLQKQDWNTIQALISISKATGHGKKSIGYSGVKDRTSVSVQLASIFGVTPEQLLAVRLKDISINGAWRSNGVKMGGNLGNAFEVVISDAERPDNSEKIISELNGKIPNYFDRQRFGSRLNNARIGLAIMGGDFKTAVMLNLTDPTGERNEKAIEARKKLAEEMDFVAAMGYFPGYLKNEHSMLAHLADESTDYAGAIRKMPRGITLMFIHAVQSLIFNLETEKRISDGNFESKAYCKADRYGFPDSDTVTEERTEFPMAPLVGYETKDEQISDAAREVMLQLGITKESFKIKSMPELSMRGSFRPLLAPVKRLSAKTEGSRITLAFSLPSGSYATVLINEITKAEDLDLKVLAGR